MKIVKQFQNIISCCPAKNCNIFSHVGELFRIKQWRRERDSNPRPARAGSGFQDRRVQPLRHLSADRPIHSIYPAPAPRSIHNPPPPPSKIIPAAPAASTASVSDRLSRPRGMFVRVGPCGCSHPAGSHGASAPPPRSHALCWPRPAGPPLLHARRTAAPRQRRDRT